MHGGRRPPPRPRPPGCAGRPRRWGPAGSWIRRWRTGHGFRGRTALRRAPGGEERPRAPRHRPRVAASTGAVRRAPTSAASWGQILLQSTLRPGAIERRLSFLEDETQARLPRIGLQLAFFRLRGTVEQLLLDD